MNSTNYPEIPDYQIFRGWSINKEPVPSSDLDEKGGWRYSNHQRRRLWEQLFVKNSQFESAVVLMTHFQSKFRAINVSFVRRALGQTHEYQIQMVLESQRFSTDLYSSCNLHFNDPPAWSCAPVSTVSSPCDIPPSSLIPLTKETTPRLPRGWVPLHDFMFVTYPSRDLSGWQYSTDFHSQSYSSSQFLHSPPPPPHKNTAPSSSSPPPPPRHTHGEDLHQVRRRLWIRTLVKACDLLPCRELFSRYLHTHPRGHIIATRLYRQSHYRKRWCFGIGLLTDHKIHIFLDNNYQHHVTYALEGCEVSVLSQRTRDPHSATSPSAVFNDPSHVSAGGGGVGVPATVASASSFPFLGKPISPRKFHLFGLKYLTSQSASSSSSRLTTSQSLSSTSKSRRELEGSLQCILSTLTNKDRDLWICSLSHQLALVNLHRYPLPTPYGVKLTPSLLSESNTLSDNLWRRVGNIWKLNYFELRREGRRLCCFEEGVLVEEISLLEGNGSGGSGGCVIQIPPDNHFHFPFGVWREEGGFLLLLLLSCETEAMRQLWITSLQAQISEGAVDGTLSEVEKEGDPSSPPVVGNGSEWFDSADLMDRSCSPLPPLPPPSLVTFESLSHHHSSDPNQTTTNTTTLSNMTTPLVQYLRDKIHWGDSSVYEPLMNVRIESYNTERESDQLSDYDTEEEFHREFNREESDDSVHSLGKLMYSELLKTVP
jgi:hypothetical protein